MADLTHDGAGVVKIDGFPVFVKQALPGETIDVKVVKIKKQYGFGKLIKIHVASPERIEPPCPIYNRCGGCSLQHLSYEGQLHEKQKQVMNVMERIGGFTHLTVHPVKGMTDPWRYRNKSQVPVGEEQGRIIAGFYAERSHSIVDMEACLIQHEDQDRIVNLVKELANQHGIRGYDDQKHKGVLRHVVIRRSRISGDVMVVLVTKEQALPHKEQLIQAITGEVPNVTSIMQNINPKRTNVIFGDKTVCLWGEETIKDRIKGIEFVISAKSFYQVNPVQTEVLYEQALNYAALTGSEKVIDAYCGIGTISLFLAQKARHVYGVESVAPAIDDAKRNAKANHIDNVTFAVGEAETLMPWWYSQGLDPDVIVVDPPRKGCETAMLDAMAAMKPERIVYVSCNPATLARDMKYLSEKGYTVKEVQPVDMFPQTTHVEAVTVMYREG
ncbi:23S rRNA (uracil(1939)-C(5))-methyltransferase RlmD [Salisediminibacterium selenitireducens]|uniref:RNA methyltransferase, TrmA family n=1 Tax=Bacillus selenitireducens (strain ATCC 700615 / DSM 15326 / MLS10) TaxID=439292 RepID=D6XYX8_BACIE|nr:23S rRNA (uracil(1939)-C(5))-methyltransferase RlmD [Salisediminibacterium selenitireducens]ADH98286.1 RNA methyltransferase, TrmA family [[Bacillus] selenitireducens MLS10]